MAYEIEGRLLEVCTCNVLCPCWVGEDPDHRTCDSTIALAHREGQIEGINVDGLTLAVSAHIPENILIPKSWKAAVFVDERATDEQEQALLKAVHRAARRRDRRPRRPHRRGRRRRAGADHLQRRAAARAGSRSATIVDAEMIPFVGATGNPDRPSPRPCSDDPRIARLRRARPSTSRATAATTGCPSVDLKDNNALQGHFRFAA